MDMMGKGMAEPEMKPESEPEGKPEKPGKGRRLARRLQNKGTGKTTTGSGKANTGKAGQMCCKAMTSACLACAKGMTEADYCRMNPSTTGCSAMNAGGKGTGKGSGMKG